MEPVAIALGSNLGDRRAHMDYAVARLRGVLGDVRVSSFLETEPVGVVGEQPAFLNAALTGSCGLRAGDLLCALLQIEQEQGRERPFRGAPRTLDLDLILYGTMVIDQPELLVPHPRFRERRFVLEPLAEIAGAWVDPVTGQTISALLEQRRTDEEGRQ
jgi:2-amino-4-hydroxy-6-hydroxymethyldihydropteridine diphosphokinase